MSPGGRSPCCAVPAGMSQGCFFQKHQLEGAGDYIVVSEDPEDGKSLIGIDDFDGLIALVQASALEIHPWEVEIRGSRSAGPADFRSGSRRRTSNGTILLRAALEVRARLNGRRTRELRQDIRRQGPACRRAGRAARRWDGAKDYCRAVAEAHGRSDSRTA